jgi:hypothetical protein
MGPPRPTFVEAWQLLVWRCVRWFAALAAAVGIAILVIDTIYLAREHDYRSMGMVWLGAAFSLGIAYFFFRLAGTLIQRMQQDTRNRGSW